MNNHSITFRNLFPEDTRLVEFCSAISLMFIGFLISTNAPTSSTLHGLLEIQRFEFWAALSLIFGSIQFISLVFYPKLELLRCTMSIVCGSFLIWISLGAIYWDIGIADAGTFCIGVANLYAFVINTVQLRKIWAS